MMFAGIMLLILSLALLLIVFIAEVDGMLDSPVKWIVIGAWITGVGGTFLLTTNKYESTPKAIEVYQGKTTLEITYRDSILVDSIVVYKK